MCRFVGVEALLRPPHSSNPLLLIAATKRVLGPETTSHHLVESEGLYFRLVDPLFIGLMLRPTARSAFWNLNGPDMCKFRMSNVAEATLPSREKVVIGFTSVPMSGRADEVIDLCRLLGDLRENRMIALFGLRYLLKPCGKVAERIRSRQRGPSSPEAESAPAALRKFHLTSEGTFSTQSARCRRGKPTA